MIHLHIKGSSDQDIAWQKLLKEWCVAHRVVLDRTLKEPEIRDGNKTFVGTKAIDKFLSEYKTLMDDWYDCRCDRWLDQ